MAIQKIKGLFRGINLTMGLLGVLFLIILGPKISYYMELGYFSTWIQVLLWITAEIDFSDWMTYGYWDETYIPYVFVDKEHVIANASITKMNFVINKKKHQVLQIGTVMTKETYRDQGLSKRFFDEDLLHTLDSQALELFYYSTACKELVYFNQLADVYMIFEIEGDMLHIYDVLGIYDVHLLDLVNSLPLKEVSEVVFHFPINTRLYPEIVVKKEVNDEDVLFVLGDIFDVKNIKIPLLNHA